MTKKVLISFLIIPTICAALPKQQDTKLIDFSMANLACAAVQRVNPKVVSLKYKGYYKDSVLQYQRYHKVTELVAEKHQSGTLNLLTSKNVIKAQSLNTVSGAQKYLEKFLLKVDAERCSDLNKVIKNQL